MPLKPYCVVYVVCGLHYHYRCRAVNSRQARRLCREYMGVDNEHITEVYLEWD